MFPFLSYQEHSWATKEQGETEHCFFLRFFFPSLLSPKHVAWLCCLCRRDNSWADSVAALSPSFSCLAVPSAVTHNQFFHPQGAAPAHLDLRSCLHPLAGGDTTFGCDTPLLPTAASLPTIPFPWSPRGPPKLQVLPHYTNSAHTDAKCKAWITTHFRVQLEQGWESSLDGCAVAELLLVQVLTQGGEGREDSMEAWQMGKDHGLDLQDR